MNGTGREVEIPFVCSRCILMSGVNVIRPDMRCMLMQRINRTKVHAIHFQIPSIALSGVIAFVANHSEKQLLHVGHTENKHSFAKSI